MSDKTKIQWTDATWSPVLGCSPASSGCAGCYAVRTVWRMAHNPNRKIADARAGLVEKTSAGTLRWTGAIRCLPDHLAVPLGWREPRRIFVANQSDLFHDDVPVDFIAEVFGVMAVAGAQEPGERESAQVKAGDGGAFHGPGDGHELIGKGPYRFPRYGHGPHVFQVLTKRAERMAYLLNLGSFREKVAAAAYRWAMDRRDAGYLSDCISARPSPCAPGRNGRMWPLSNVEILVSVENQATADQRIPHLLRTPAAVRGLSCEPLLGPVDIDATAPVDDPYLPRLDWVIVGGESGPAARPCAEEWIRALVEDCRGAGVACFVKQLGAYPVSEARTAPAEMMAHPERLTSWDRAPNGEVWAWRAGLKDRKGGDPAEWPEDLRVREMPPEVRCG